MARLPTVGSDTGTWGTVLNDYLTESASLATLATSPSAGATSFDLAVIPTALKVGSLIAIDAYTTQCELRSVTAISSLTVTVDTALKFAHASGDAVRLVEDAAVPVSYFGLLGDGTNEWEPVQRLFREATLYGSLVIKGGSATYDIQQPVLLDSGSRVERLQLRSRTGFTPIDANGAVLLVGNGSFTITADASTDTITTSAAHGAAVSEKVSFMAAYGETLPGGITAGRIYYVKTTPSSTTLTISATDGGATLDIISNGTGGIMLGSIEDLTRIHWESLRLDLTITDLNGIRVAPQQPSWTRNLRIEMDAAATTQGSAIGLTIGGQLSYHDNVEINTSAKCVGARVTGTGISMRGFNCNGVLNADTGMIIDGSRHNISDLWTEQCGRAGVEIGPGASQARGIVFGGYWLQSSGTPTTSPALLVSSTNASFVIQMMRTSNSGGLLVDDDARNFSLFTSDVADGGLVLYNYRQAYGTQTPFYGDQTAVFVSSTPYTLLRGTRYLMVDPTAGAVTVNLPTAANFAGAIHTIKHRNASGNSVTIDPAGSETIDGNATHTLTARQSITILSDNSNWLIVD